MSDAVHWLLALNIKEGELDNFKALVKEMVDATKANEPGTLNYEWFVSDDEKTCHIYERYADSAATMSFGDLRARLRRTIHGGVGAGATRGLRQSE